MHSDELSRVLVGKRILKAELVPDRSSFLSEGGRVVLTLEDDSLVSFEASARVDSTIEVRLKGEILVSV